MFLCPAGSTTTGSSGNTGNTVDTTSNDPIKEPVTLVDAVLKDINSRFNVQLTRANSRYFYYYSSYADASLDCPQSGKTYAQAPTWGWQILVRPTTGGSYDYRGMDAANFWACS
jgi:hypothetical protein